MIVFSVWCPILNMKNIKANKRLTVTLAIPSKSVEGVKHVRLV